MIKLSKSCIGDEEKKAVLDVLDLEYLGMGKVVKDFESELSKYFKRKVVCVSSGTSALHLALQAANVGKGDEVLIQSLTYVASYQAISATGAIPVSCDIDPKTLTLDIKDIKRKINSKTKAIMPVHYSGDLGLLDEIYEIASTKGLRVIEDAAHAFGSMFNGKLVGSFGDIVCFSFDGIKNITSGEGGCVVSSDKKLLKKIEDARLLGVVSDTRNRFDGKRSWAFDVRHQGWRYHMSNIMAAIGKEQLKKSNSFFKHRQKLAQYYDQKLFQNKNIETFNRDYNSIVPHIYVIKLINNISRHKFRQNLLKNGIETGMHYQPNHLLKLYQQKKNHNLYNTENIYEKLVTLPLHPDLTISDVDFITEKIIFFLENV